MDQNSPPPSGDTPERPMGETPREGQPPQGQPPGAYAPPPGYNPPPQGYGGPQQPGAPPMGGPPPGYQPQGAPPSGYPPQGYPPPGYQPQGYPPPGPPQGYPPPGYGPPKRSGGMPVWAWVIIGLVAVLIIGCVGLIAGLTYLGTKVSSSFSSIGAELLNSFEPITVASAFYTDLESRDYDSAHGLLSTELASRYSSTDLQTMWQSLESAQGTITPGFPRSNDRPGSSTNRTTASVDQELTSEKGKTYKVTLQMEKSGGTWLIKDASPGLIPEP
jgi:Flp pilus assembly pilin Flp